VVRLRSAAVDAVASLAPCQARHFLRILLLTTLVVAAGCSSAAVRSEPSGLGNASTETLAPASVRRTATISHESLRSARDAAVEIAWVKSKTAFYRAALAGQPQYPPLLATLVPGGPVFEHSIAYLSALAAAGVRGPRRWRVGNERVVSVGATRARVRGCLFDTGSVSISTGARAPASLGGGAGLTASDAALVLAGGTWRVLTDDVTAVSSPKEPGPCHGF
jgi:hypothetical protein